VDTPVRTNLERVSACGTPSSPKCPPESSHQKRDGTILMQQDARDELKIFSQARGARLSALPGYAYDARGGQGITVYVMDTGINPDHPVSTLNSQFALVSVRLTHLQEFRNMQGSLRWLYLPTEPHIQSDAVGHGTCTTSKVVGPAFGVAKSANIVVVKIQPVVKCLI